MVLYDRLLVPTDGSAEGERAVEHALQLAAAHDASVHALYVINTASYAGLPMESSWDGIDELLYSDADAAVRDVEAVAEPYDVDVTTAVVEGSPSREIIRYAEEEDCDIVVMGTHGRGGIDRLLLGSVAEKVVRGSSVPVLTVRLGEEGPPELGEPDAPPSSTDEDEDAGISDSSGPEASGSS